MGWAECPECRWRVIWGAGEFAREGTGYVMGEPFVYYCDDCGLQSDDPKDFNSKGAMKISITSATDCKVAGPFESRAVPFALSGADLRGSEPTPLREYNDLPPDHPDHWCGYCEDSAYDGGTCEECDGDGCESCAYHGFWGYSW